MSDRVKELKYTQYESLLDDEEVREKIALKLMEKYDYLKASSIKEISSYIKLPYKDLFLKLKDGVFTLD